GCAGLALADALHLRSVEGIQLPAALALLLRTDLIGAREWPGECRLEVRVACDLASDVANEPAKPGAQNAQLSAVAVELFGMGITRCHHGGALGDAHVRLPQPHAVLPGQPGQSLDRSVQKLRIGREGNVLGCTVVSTVTRAKSFVRSAPLSSATRKLSASRSSSLLPRRLRQWLRSERSCGNSCWKNSSPVKCWKYGS